MIKPCNSHFCGKFHHPFWTTTCTRSAHTTQQHSATHWRMSTQELPCPFSRTSCCYSVCLYDPCIPFSIPSLVDTARFLVHGPRQSNAPHSQWLLCPALVTWLALLVLGHTQAAETSLALWGDVRWLEIPSALMLRIWERFLRLTDSKRFIPSMYC